MHASGDSQQKIRDGAAEIFFIIYYYIVTCNYTQQS